MPIYRLFALACLPLLGACQLLGGHAAPTQPQRIAWEQRAEDCRKQRCSLVNVDTLRFADQPALDRLIEQALLAMTREETDAPLPASLRAHGDELLRRQPEGWETWLQAKLLDRHDELLVIELSSYLYRGGAHGQPGRGFLNYSTRLERALQLADLLQPGQEAAFWQAAGEAHRRWLAALPIDDREEFLRDWPFQPTDNVALLGDRVLLKYDVYALAPYAMGHPSLEIPYDRLRQILKPEYLPRNAR
ncbi:RsiV family protein [Pseudomonas stutzeri]|nr:RsiV family protein [Stutzerimonas stutzeri]